VTGRRPPSRNLEPAHGLGVDAVGDPVVDPTRNVLDLVGAAIQRQDDLRAADQRLADEARRHSREIAEVRAGYEDRLRAQEAERINAIRQIDVNAVQRAAEVSAQQAQTLAAQVAQSAEALRTQVQAAASAATTALAAALEPIQKDIADLRRAQYEAQGKQGQQGESRLNLGAIFGGLAVLVSIIALIVLLARG